MSVQIEITTDIEPWIDGDRRQHGDIVETEDLDTVEVFLSRDWAVLVEPVEPVVDPVKGKK